MSAFIPLLVSHKRIPCRTAVFLDMWRMGGKGYHIRLAYGELWVR